MSAVQLHGIHAGFLAADGCCDKIIPELGDFTMAHGMHSGGTMIGKLDLGRSLYRPDNLLLFQSKQKRSAFENTVQDFREAVHDGNDHGK